MRGWIRYADGGAKSSYWLGTLGWLLNKRLDDSFLAKRFLASEAGVFRCGSARLGLLLIFFSGFVQSPLQAALTWNYFTTDGVDSLSGTFETDGDNTDLSGAGVHQFALTEVLSWYVNGVSVASDFPGNGRAAPSQPFGFFSSNVVDWDQTSQSVINRESFQLDAVFPLFSPSPSWRITYPELTVGPAGPNSHLSGLPENIRVNFTPIMTTITPVPEPGEWGGIVGVGLIVALGIRRRLLNNSGVLPCGS